MSESSSFTAGNRVNETSLGMSKQSVCDGWSYRSSTSGLSPPASAFAALSSSGFQPPAMKRTKASELYFSSKNNLQLISPQTALVLVCDMPPAETPRSRGS